MSAAANDPGEDSPVIALTGEVNFKSVPDLRKKLIKVVKRSGGHLLNLNFLGVTRMDTSGVAMLLELQEMASSRGGRLSLTGLNEQVRRMIQLARLDQVLGVLMDEQVDEQ